VFYSIQRISRQRSHPKIHHWGNLELLVVAPSLRSEKGSTQTLRAQDDRVHANVIYVVTVADCGQWWLRIDGFEWVSIFTARRDFKNYNEAEQVYRLAQKNESIEWLERTIHLPSHAYSKWAESYLYWRIRQTPSFRLLRTDVYEIRVGSRYQLVVNHRIEVSNNLS
jgi:hypothetical protein